LRNICNFCAILIRFRFFAADGHSRDKACLVSAEYGIYAKNMPPKTKSGLLKVKIMKFRKTRVISVSFPSRGLGMRRKQASTDSRKTS